MATKQQIFVNNTLPTDKLLAGNGTDTLNEITLGTNLSFTGTTLNAASGGGYTYLAITLSANTSYNKAALGGANYLFVQTNDANGRNLTIDNTGFVANDYLYISVSQVSLGSVNILIDTQGFPQRGNILFAVFNGTHWAISTISSSHNTTSNNQYTYSDGLSNRANGTFSSSSGTNIQGTGNYNQRYGSDINTSTNDYVTVIGYSISSTGANSILIGRSTSAGADSVSIGSQATGTGLNCVRIGRSVTTSANTGVVAIGQGITTTNTDAVVIGRAASAGGTANVTIGGGSTGTGANCVRIGASTVTNNATSSVAVGQGITIGTGGANVVAIGQGVNTSTNTGVVAIGQGITTTNTDAVVIGRAASASGNNAISIGANASVTNGQGIAIGNVANTNQSYALCLGYAATATSEMRQIAFGALSFPRHYGAVSRRIDTNTALLDATTPARHNDNSSWNGQTPNATPKILTLFDVAGKRLTLQDGEALHFDIMITAKQTGSTNTLIRRIAGGAVRGAGVGTTAIVGQTTLYTHGAALTTTVSADTANGAVQIEVTGNANTWEWTCSVDYQRTRTE